MGLIVSQWCIKYDKKYLIMHDIFYGSMFWKCSLETILDLIMYKWCINCDSKSLIVHPSYTFSMPCYVKDSKNILSINTQLVYTLKMLIFDNGWVNDA